MNICHIIYDHYFSRAYESRYSVLRRFFIANMGPELKQIINRLRSAHPPELANDASYQDRILHAMDCHANLLPWATITARPRGGCVRCQQQLFHSELYDQPWLHHCPIHHDPIVATCPVCHEPWPTFEELPSRHCPGCGIVPISTLIQCGLDNPEHLDSQALDDFVDFCDADRREMSLCGVHELHASSWLDNPSVHAPEFSRVRVNDATNPLPDQIKQAVLPCVDAEPLRLQRSRLYPRNGDDWLERSCTLTTGLIKSRSNVARAILHQLKALSSEDHQYQIVSYDTLLTTPVPPYICPACLALSVWFDYVHSYPYLRQQYTGHFSYGGLRIFEHLSLLPAIPKTMANDHGVLFYDLDDAFCLWLYERMLKFIFVQLLVASDALFKPPSPESKLKLIDDVNAIAQLGQLGQILHDGASLNYYHRLEDPLSLIAHTDAQGSAGLCSASIGEHTANNKAGFVFYQPLHEDLCWYTPWRCLELRYRRYRSGADFEHKEAEQRRWIGALKSRFYANKAGTCTSSIKH